jgi:hypothetical protein
MLAVAIFLLFLIEKLIKYFIKLNSVIRWVLFLPVSIARSCFCVLILWVIFGGIFPIKENVLVSINWSVAPIIFLHTINKTIPRHSKIAVNILGVLWIIGSVYEIITQSGRAFARVIQIVSMLVYIIYQNNILLKKNTVTDEGDDE